MRTFIQAMFAMTLLSAVALAQELPAPAQGSFQVRYAANLAAGDSIINLTNAGPVQTEADPSPTIDSTDLLGDICANVYVFAEDQQLIACCACPLTPNHLRTLSVDNDLISNTLTPGVPIGVTVALLSTDGSEGSCNPAAPGESIGGLKAWGTTLHAVPGGGYGVTETAFSPAQLSASEYSKLISYCGFIQADGSGYGICKSCANGAAGAAKQ